MANFHITGLPSNLMFAGLGLPALPTDPNYKAVITANYQKSVVGSKITFDGTSSFSPNTDPLFYFWAFKTVPIGSQVERYLFTSLEADDSIVSFSPDVPGYYEIELIIGDINFLSPPTFTEVLILVQLVPQNQGVVPDDKAKEIWNALGDFWNLYSDRERFTVVWSSFIQIIANELLGAFQVDYNKSIKDIQDFFQKKWISYSTKLLVSEASKFIISDELSGILASTNLLNVIDQPEYGNVIVIPQTEAILSKTAFGKNIKAGKLIKVGDISYNIVRATESTIWTQAFIEEDIKTGRTHLPWRIASTLISDIDLETFGVSPDDNLHFTISRLGTNFTTNVSTKVVGIKDNKLLFTIGKGILLNGQISGGLTNSEIIKIFSDLHIDSVSEQLDGTLFYSGDAKDIYNYINTILFKRFFFEEELNNNSAFAIGKYTFTITPSYIIRNNKINISNLVMGIPTLQEYIKQPIVVNDGSLIGRVFGDLIVSLKREPIFLSENIDYSVINNKVVGLSCNIIGGDPILTLPYADLLDKNIQEGDTLTIEVGLNRNIYSIRKILDQERLEVFPIPTTTQNNIRCKILRRLPGKYLQFAPGVFSDTNPAPDKLWAELTYIDNSIAIENNFGSMVNITKEQYDNQGITAPYKAAIAGLMYSYSRGPTIYDLKLGAQILLGLPFTYHMGIVTQIDPEYKLDDNLAPFVGRILIDEINARGEKTGLTDIYFYPRGKQKFNILTSKWEDQDPQFSGLGINNRTGSVIKEGDVIDQFTILSKGVEISDYLSDPEWFNGTIGQGSLLANIQKYHKAFLRANADLFGTADFDFVSSFIRKTKPHYVDLLPIVLKSLVDEVKVTDFLFFKPKFLFFEAMGISLPNATKFDGYAITQEYFTFEGNMYTRYIYGYDLQTTYSSLGVTSPSGGFINPRINEFHDTPYILPDDMVVIHNGLNAGVYPVDMVLSDTTLTLNTPANFQTGTEQAFSIYRKIINPIFTGTVTVNTSSNSVTLSNGKLSAGVAVNDILIFNDGTVFSKPYIITQVEPTLVHTPITEPGGIFDCEITRPGLLKNPLVEISIQETMGDPWVSFIPGDLNKAGLVEVKDTIHTDTSIYTIMDIDRQNGKAYVVPTPAATIISNVKITRDGLPSSTLTVDIADLFINDPITLIFRDMVNTVATNAGSTTVLIGLADDPVVLGIRPGDFFRIFVGPDAANDIGFGPGVYPIIEVTPTTLELTRPMIATQNTASYAYQIVKK